MVGFLKVHLKSFRHPLKRPAIDDEDLRGPLNEIKARQLPNLLFSSYSAGSVTSAMENAVDGRIDVRAHCISD
jgi:SOS-response transcriptional repressor LexA